MKKNPNTIDTTTFEGRLEKEILEKYGSVYSFANKNGLVLNSIQNYVSGNSTPSVKVVMSFKDMGLNIDYIMKDEDVVTVDAPKEIFNTVLVKKFTSPVRGGTWNMIENSRFRYLPLPSNFIKGIKDPAIVDVVGDSMKPIIKFKDSVIFDLAAEAKDKDVVICTYEGNTIIKYFRNRKGVITLESENNSYEPIIVQSELTIHGVVKKVLHNF